MQAARQWLFVFVLTASLLGLGPVQPSSAKEAASQGEAAVRPIPALQTNFLEFTGPTACPSGGCAGGQRIGVHFGFGLTSIGYDTQSPNIKVCIYASTKWNSVPEVDNNRTGELSGLAYSAPANSDDSCPKDANAPPGFTPILESVASLPQGLPSDALRFAFRLGPNGNEPNGPNIGQVVAYLFIHTASGWSTSPAVSGISPTLGMAQPSTANVVYVANDGPTCGIYRPCYINSDGDKDNGIGTGLKDAVDISSGNSSIINIIGSYTVKANTVKIDKKLTLTGSNDATITYSGPTTSCSAAILSLDETVTLHGLNIDDGNCTDPNRGLVEINSHTGRNGSDDLVTIESNDLSDGDNAIYVRSDNTDKIVIRFNQITGNTGHAIFFDGNSGSPAEITANNITGNQTSINCASSASAPVANRTANHNYWGGSTPAQDTTHCPITAAKRLGMSISHNSNSPGVNAGLVSVTDSKAYATRFDNQLAFKRTGGSNFNIYVVDHGYMTSGGPPFTQTGESPSPCSNYWDIFLPYGTSPPTTLDLYMKYYNKENKTPGCLVVINSTQYCDQTSSQGKYPLYWFDPSSSAVTKGWDPVGARPENLTSGDGQTTACNISANEIQVSIDASGRPNLSDLGYTPLMVGIPVIKYFTPLASNQLVTVTWGTNNEPDISGFNILRGTDPNSLIQINGDLITRLGSSTTGATYSRTDSGRANGTTYYYRLQVVRTDGYSFYSAIVSITANAATPTPTWTASPVRPTITPQFTPVPTNKPTHTPTKSLTPQKTWTPGPTSLNLPTLTSTLDLLIPGAYDTLTAIAALPQSDNQEGSETPDNSTSGEDLTITPGGTPGTAVAFLGSVTPNPHSTPTFPEVVAGKATNTNPWLSLLLGLFAGLVIVGGTGRWWYSTRN
jgi:hypothetical protein